MATSKSKTRSGASSAAPSPDSLAGYSAGAYANELVLAPAKVGKTITIVGNLLGAMPWQENGGVVDKPSHLHVITFDAVTLDGAEDFYVRQCGASKEVGDVHVINLEKHARKAFASQTDYDGTFPAKVYDAIHKVQDMAAKGGVHALVVASLTMCAKAWLRSISGPAFGGAATMRKSPMDQNKWGLFAQQMTEFQFHVQTDTMHVIWETHWSEKESKTKKDSSGNAQVFDSIQVQGKTSEQFPAQCARPYMLQRTKGGGYGPSKKVDMVLWDTQPNLDFGESVMAGRKVVGVLEPKEPDLTVMFHKLGLTIGGYGT